MYMIVRVRAAAVCVEDERPVAIVGDRWPLRVALLPLMSWTTSYVGSSLVLTTLCVQQGNTL